MKLRQMIPQRKLRATAVRRAPSRAAEEEDEPTMRLSSAFIVVVLLHLVAIGGIITFEKVKVHRNAASEAEAPTRSAPAAAPASAAREEAPKAPVAARETAPASPALHAPAASAAHETHKPAPAPVAAAPAAHEGIRDSGTIHVVAKGENPVVIAKKYGIEYDSLLKLNKIEDPRKLPIGQKLHIPAKAKN